MWRKWQFQIKVLAIVAVASSINGTISLADDQHYFVQRFKELNKLEHHSQFKGNNINILYSCIYARGLKTNGACAQIDTVVSKQNVVRFLKVYHQDEMAINLLISKTKYPEGFFAYKFPACGKKRSETTSITLMHDISRQELEKCYLVATLLHLGFYVDDKMFHEIDYKNFEEIITYYTK